MVSLKRNQIQVKFHDKLSPNQKKWTGYRGFLSQILINLLTNIERYAYPNGSSGSVDVKIELENDTHYRLSVTDYGKGIAREHQTRIFEPFFTTGRSVGGSGLGLTIVHNLVKNAMKGEIRLTSEVGKGTTFKIILPKVIVE
jgi:signal transduction histidine kinase